MSRRITFFVLAASATLIAMRTRLGWCADRRLAGLGAFSDWL